VGGLKVDFTVQYRDSDTPSHKAHQVALIFISLAPRLHCKTMHMGLVHHAVCLFMPQLLLVLSAPVSWPG